MITLECGMVINLDHIVYMSPESTVMQGVNTYRCDMVNGRILGISQKDFDVICNLKLIYRKSSST